MSSGEWTTVKTRVRTHRGPRVHSKKKAIDTSEILDECVEDSDTCVQRVKSAQRAITESRFYQDSISIIRSHTQMEYERIVILGVGNVSKSKAALLQLAFGLELMREFQISTPGVIYDPVMVPFEQDICLRLGLVLGSDEMDIHSAPAKTLYYMPHCPYLLYTQVLWSNWGDCLHNIEILGNR
jgi:hypothetical protein